MEKTGCGQLVILPRYNLESSAKIIFICASIFISEESPTISLQWILHGEHQSEQATQRFKRLAVNNSYGSTNWNCPRQLLVYYQTCITLIESCNKLNVLWDGAPFKIDQSVRIMRNTAHRLSTHASYTAGLVQPKNRGSAKCTHNVNIISLSLYYNWSRLNTSLQLYELEIYENYCVLIQDNMPEWYHCYNVYHILIFTDHILGITRYCLYRLCYLNAVFHAVSATSANTECSLNCIEWEIQLRRLLMLSRTSVSKPGSGAVDRVRQRDVDQLWSGRMSTWDDIIHWLSSKPTTYKLRRSK